MRPRPSNALCGPLAVALALAVGSAGCPGIPVDRGPLPAPSVAASVRHHAGSALAGGASIEVVPPERTSPPGLTGRSPGPGGEERTWSPPESALEVLATFVALERLPPEALDALGTRARLFAATPAVARGPAAPEDDVPLVAVPRFLLGARAAPIESVRAFVESLERGDLGRASRFAELRGALPSASTAAFELVGYRSRGSGVATLVRGGNRDELTFAVHRTRVGVSDQLDISIEAALAEASGGPGARRAGREIAVLERLPMTGSMAFAVIVPSIFDGDEAGAIAVAISVRPAPGPTDVGFGSHRFAYVSCLADLARSVFEARMRRELPLIDPTPIPAAAAPDLLVAREALADPARRRVALLALARTSGAQAALDLALGADDACIEKTAAAVAAALKDFAGSASSPELGFVVERAALGSITTFLAGTETPLAISAISIRRAGAVGRLPATLRAAIDAAKDGEDLDRQIAAANRAVLDDPYPLLRVQAYDWLVVRGLAPADFDPLGDGAQRRAALEAAEKTAERAPGPGAPP